MTESKKKILIADDHEIVRRGVKNLLSTVPKWEVCGEACTGTDAVDLASKLRPDLVILDVTFPPTDGLAVAKELRLVSADTKILIFSMHDSDEMVRSLLAAGVQGYVLKSEADRFLLSAVETILNGQTCFSTQVSNSIVNALAGKTAVIGTRPASESGLLTKRQIEIVTLLANGKSNKEIARQLFISIKTVETHRQNIMQKLNFSTIVELVHWAIKNHLIESSPSE